MAGRRPQDAGDAQRRSAGPAGADDEVAAWPGAIHAAEVRESIRPLVAELVEPEAVAELGHLQHDRAHAEVEHAEPIQHVAVRARHERRPWSGLLGEHGEFVERGDWQTSALAGAWHEGDAGTALMDIGQRPAPDIGLTGYGPNSVWPKEAKAGGSGVHAHHCGRRGDHAAARHDGE